MSDLDRTAQHLAETEPDLIRRAHLFVAAYHAAPWPVHPDLHAMLTETQCEYIVARPDDPRPVAEQPRLPTILEAVINAHELFAQHQRPIDTWIWDGEQHQLHGPYTLHEGFTRP